MWVGDRAAADLRFGLRRAPDLRVRQEEALLGRVAVDHLVRLRLRGALEGFVRDGQAAEVRDRFALDELTLVVHAGDRLQ